MTSNTKQDLEDFKKTLTRDEMETLEDIIKHKGEEYAISILGHLKSNLEYVRSL